MIALALALALVLAPALALAEGDLSVFVFDGAAAGQPLKGAVVRVGDIEASTNRDGRARITLDDGAHTVTIGPPSGLDRIGGRIAVRITPGDVSELIATLNAEAAPLFELEQRAADSAPDVDAAAVDPATVTASLSGRALDPDGRGIAGVQVFVRGRPESAETDREGRFTLTLPVGAHGLSFIHPQHKSGQRELDLPAEGATTEVTLEPAGLALEDFVVTAPYIAGGVAELTAERRQTGNVVDVVGAEQMSRAGDSSAASALKRVTGLTIVGGKYIYVRGMGERYSATTLNGMFVPSPEPERRVVPLDMFPTGVLGSVVVQKTVSPDQAAEFGGGVVQLRTRGVPDEAFVEVALSGGFTTGTTLEDGAVYAGGGLDWLGIDDGTRALPERLQAEFDRSELLRCSGVVAIPGQGPCVTQAELDDLAGDLDPVWARAAKTLPPDFGASVAAGDGWDLGGGRLGVVGSLGYDQGWQIEEGVKNDYGLSGGELDPNELGTYSRTTRAVDTSAILELALDWGDGHQLRSTTLLLRNTDDVAGFFEGRQFGNENNELQITRLQWVERQLLTQQLRGRHRLPLDLRMRWHYGVSRADRSEPDRRTWQYDKSRGRDEPFRLSAKPDSNRRFFSDLDDTTHDVGLATRYPLGEAPKSIGEEVSDFIELGAGLLRRTRDVSSVQIHLEELEGTPVTEPIESLLVPENIGGDGWFYAQNDTRVGDAYRATLGTEAGWLALQAGLDRLGFDGAESLRVTAGLRVEHAAMTVRSFAPIGDDPPPGELDDVDLLPSAGLTWAFAEAMQLRAGYGRSINRPEFREKSELRFDDVIDRRSYRGNPDVERAIIDHFDLRWEWYPSPRESASVALFYKAFTDPIEQIIEAGADQTIKPANTAGATNLGVELDARQGLGALGDWADDLYVAGNVALIASAVEIDQTVAEGEASLVLTSSERPLQGQSPYVVNLQLGYEDLDRGAFVTVLYNVTGPRVVGVGTNDLPDILQAPRHLLDVVVGLPLADGLSLKLKARNLLDSPVEETQAGGTPARYTEGVGFSVGLTLKL